MVFPVAYSLSNMAPIDGLIILDPSGKPIITSHFRAHTPNYPLLHIDAYNQALARRKPSYAGPSAVLGGSGAGGRCAQTTRDELEPVLWVTVPVGQGTFRVKRRDKKQLGGGGYAGSDSSEEEDEDDEDDEDDETEEDDEQVQAGTWQTAGLCHLEREGMSFLAPLSHEGESPLEGAAHASVLISRAVNPLFAFAFLECFLDVLAAYFGQVTETSIRDNFDIVYMVRPRAFPFRRSIERTAS